MTRETVEARKLELAKQREQLLARVNALTGAIEDCDYWLRQLDSPPSPKE